MQKYPMNDRYKPTCSQILEQIETERKENGEDSTLLTRRTMNRILLRYSYKDDLEIWIICNLICIETQISVLEYSISNTQGASIMQICKSKKVIFNFWLWDILKQREGSFLEVLFYILLNNN